MRWVLLLAALAGCAASNLHQAREQHLACLDHYNKQLGLAVVMSSTLDTIIDAEGACWGLFDALKANGSPRALHQAEECLAVHRQSKAYEGDLRRVDAEADGTRRQCVALEKNADEYADDARAQAEALASIGDAFRRAGEMQATAARQSTNCTSTVYGNTVSTHCY